MSINAAKPLRTPVICLPVSIRREEPVRSRHFHIYRMTSGTRIHGGLVGMVTFPAVKLPQMRVMGIRVEFTGSCRHLR